MKKTLTEVIERIRQQPFASEQQHVLSLAEHIEELLNLRHARFISTQQQLLFADCLEGAGITQFRDIKKFLFLSRVGVDVADYQRWKEFAVNQWSDSEKKNALFMIIFLRYANQLEIEDGLLALRYSADTTIKVGSEHFETFINSNFDLPDFWIKQLSTFFVEQYYATDEDDERLAKERERIATLFTEAFIRNNKDPSSASYIWDNHQQMRIYIPIQELISEATSVAEALNIFQQQKGLRAPKNVSKDTKLKIIVTVLILDLENHGFFIKEKNNPLKCYYYDEETREVYVIKEDNSASYFFLSRIANKYNIINDVQKIIDAIYNYAFEHSVEREIYYLFYYDSSENKLYIFDRDRHYYILDGKTITREQNGKTILFVKDSLKYEKFTYLDPDKRRPIIPICGITVPGGNIIQQVFCNRANYDSNGLLTAKEQARLLTYAFYSVPFVQFLRSKPILTFVGEKGSGKTFTFKMWGLFFHKLTHRVKMLPEKREDAWSVLSNNLLVIWDNVDRIAKERWFEDTIAAVSTGAGIEKRVLYTNNSSFEANPNCYVCITTRDPQFNRDDVTDRLLIFRVQRLQKFISETVLLKPVEEFRDELWSYYLDDLNKIVAELGKIDLDAAANNHRLADFIGIATAVDNAFGLSDTPVDREIFFDKVQQIRSDFVWENDPLYPFIERYAREHANITFTATQMRNTIAEEYNYPAKLSIQKIGRKLKDNYQSLKDLLGLEIVRDKSKSRRNSYIFVSRDSVSANDELSIATVTTLLLDLSKEDKRVLIRKFERLLAQKLGKKELDDSDHRKLAEIMQSLSADGIYVEQGDYLYVL